MEHLARLHFLIDLNGDIQLQNLHYVVDVDIKGFFDNINHAKLISEAKICQLSSSMIEITAKESKKSLIMPISNIDTERLADIGISEKGANDIKKSFEKSISDKKCPDRQTLSEIKHFAQEKFKEISQAVKDKVISKGKGGQEH